VAHPSKAAGERHTFCFIPFVHGSDEEPGIEGKHSVQHSFSFIRSANAAEEGPRSAFWCTYSHQTEDSLDSRSVPRNPHKPRPYQSDLVKHPDIPSTEAVRLPAPARRAVLEDQLGQQIPIDVYRTTRTNERFVEGEFSLEPCLRCHRQLGIECFCDLKLDVCPESVEEALFSWFCPETWTPSCSMMSASETTGASASNSHSDTPYSINGHTVSVGPDSAGWYQSIEEHTADIAIQEPHEEDRRTTEAWQAAIKPSSSQVCPYCGDLYGREPLQNRRFR
jgi:hypothetical protein